MEKSGLSGRIALNVLFSLALMWTAAVNRIVSEQLQLLLKNERLPLLAAVMS